MNIFVLYKYHNYGRIGEKKEVMSVCTDNALAQRLSEKYKWDIEVVVQNRVRIDGGPFSKDKWVEEKELVTPEQKKVLEELNLWRK